MSSICILAPVVVTAWPIFSAAVVSAAATLGYTCVAGDNDKQETKEKSNSVNLELDNSQIISERLSRDERITVTKNGVCVTFYKDARNKTSICVTGEGYTEEYLRKSGEELSQRVIQDYVHQKIKNQLSQLQGVVVDESVDEDNSIRIKVRIWE